jgi:MoaA/NifB/PqqE/SkfB family radical SAM enzyme
MKSSDRKNQVKPKGGILGEVNKYRKSYGIRGVSSTALNSLSYLLGKNPVKGPIYIGWEILWRCNAKCEYCNRWRIKKKEPTTVEALKIIEDIGDLGCCILTFTGGEPLLRKDIGTLVKKAKALGMSVNINTNGSLLKLKAKELIDAGCDVITVSVESHNPKTHDSIRGLKNLFNSLSDGIEEVKRLRKSSKPNIKVRANISAYNYKDLEKFIDHWSDKVDEVVLQPIHEEVRNAFTIPNKMKFSEKERKDFIKYFNELAKKHKWLSNEYYREFPTFFFDLPKLHDRFKCFAGYFFFQLDPELNVYPCAAYLHKVGNLKDKNIKQLWKSDDMKRFRRTLKKKQNKCMCWYNCNGIINCYLNKTVGKIG